MKRLLAIAALCMSGGAVGDEGWSGELSAGMLVTSGNSETQSYNAKSEAAYKLNGWRHGAAVSTISSQDQETTTAERYAASYKLERNVTKQDYLFATVEFEKDLFGGVRERYTEAVGYGRRLIDIERHHLDAELGAGARQLRFQNPDGGREADAIGRAALRYRWEIGESSQFRQALKVEGGESNIASESLTELRLAIIGNLFTTLSFEVKNNSEVPEGRKRTDTLAAVNFGYAFGN